ncbi:MAG: CDP-glycerol glycerophosphotransferase family protein [Propionibacteriaceae bacterium]|jgi:CDP-glycerol glycerophosphotransferase|nr:CDP-glycerol glycerophosphotransferase family protein [Propionibacteriaceae bacterium]
MNWQPAIRIAGSRLLRAGLRVTHLAALSDKVFFDAGGTYSCSPKAIFQGLGEANSVWSLHRWEDCPPGARAVKWGSPAHYLELLTARVIVVNAALRPFLPIRAGQTVINTWHGGGAYKLTGGGRRLDADIVYARRESGRTALTWFLTSSRAFSEAAMSDMLVPPAKLLATGLPRNDVFFTDTAAIAAATRRKLGLGDEAIVLYAPTWRDANSHPTLSVPQLVEALETRFGKPFRCLYRGHPRAFTPRPAGAALDVTGYPDMQELLCAADVLVTDYSSSIWDFSLTGKPCFLYAPDLADYTLSPGFIRPIDDWRFPLATSNAELVAAIQAFDAAGFATAMDAHHADLGSYETGEATRAVCDIIARALHPDVAPVAVS